MVDVILRSCINAVPDPMLYLDTNWIISQANPAAIEIFGEWILGRSYVTALRQPALLKPIEAAFRSGQANDLHYTRNSQEGGTTYHIRLTPIQDSAGQDFGLLLHFADISHVSETQHMRRGFVANVSHELKTPLTALSGFIETLKGPARNDPEARERFLDIMMDEASRMNRLVSDLLSLSQVESEERMRPSETVDVQAVLGAVKAALRGQAEDGGNRIEIVAQTDRTDVQGDRDQLTQVFMNLIENAMKYGGAGKPVIVTLSEVEGRGSAKGPHLKVDVTDRGDGIDPIHLPRLTERFYRVDSHRSREMGGTGLGLAIVKHIVNRHRGRMQIQSKIGEGSTFSVLLPLG